MRLYKQLLTKNACYITGKKITPVGIMWHSTGANNPKLSRYVQPDDGILGTNKAGNHWNQANPSGRSVCVHAFIGKDKNGQIATYQTLPWNYRGWHCGGKGNDKYIGFEICEDDLKSKEYFEAVYKEACELTAYLCKLYNLDPMGTNVITCHCDAAKLGLASNHADVMHWFKKYGKTMDNVRQDVKALLQAEPLYVVQCGAFKSKANADRLATKLKAAGFDAVVVKESLYLVQCGAFSNKDNATKLAAELKAKGYSSIIVRPA